MLSIEARLLIKVIIKDKNTASHEEGGLSQVSGTEFDLAKRDKQLRGDVGKVNGCNMTGDAPDCLF